MCTASCCEQHWNAEPQRHWSRYVDLPPLVLIVLPSLPIWFIPDICHYVTLTHFESWKFYTWADTAATDKYQVWSDSDHRQKLQFFYKDIFLTYYSCTWSGIFNWTKLLATYTVFSKYQVKENFKTLFFISHFTVIQKSRQHFSTVVAKRRILMIMSKQDLSDPQWTVDIPSSTQQTQLLLEPSPHPPPQLRSKRIE